MVVGIDSRVQGTDVRPVYIDALTCSGPPSLIDVVMKPSHCCNLRYTAYKDVTPTRSRLAAQVGCKAITHDDDGEVVKRMIGIEL